MSGFEKRVRLKPTQSGRSQNGRFAGLFITPQICVNPSLSSSMGLSGRFAVYCGETRSRHSAEMTDRKWISDTFRPRYIQYPVVGPFNHCYAHPSRT